MTDKGTGGSSRVPQGQRSRRRSPWPLVIVAALPLLSLLFGLPISVTLVLLIVGLVLLAFSPHLPERRHRDPKQAWLHLMACYTKLQSAHAALKASPFDATARQRFSKLEAECLSLLGSRSDSDWGADSSYAVKVRNEIVAMSASVSLEGGNPAPAPRTEIEQLAEMNRQGVISDPQFQAFSQRFTVMTAEKARGVLETIAELRLQCQKGAMAQAAYHAAVWDLLDRLDRGDSDATQRPATPA